MTTDVLVVGAGPAGSAAAVWAARAGREVVLIDAEHFPRDKTCGDGLTPRAIAQLQLLGMHDWLRSRPRNRGIRMIGFGTEHDVLWNGPHLPDFGSAAPRTEFDEAVRQVAVQSGARFHGGVRAVGTTRDAQGRVEAVSVTGLPGVTEIRCRSLIVADGVRSRLGGSLGRVWHRDTVYGVAARAYVRSTRHDEPWITSHLELRDEQGQTVAGYGWLFPLGNGEINLGVGSLATQGQPGKVNLHALLRQYGATQRTAFGLGEELRAEASAMLPMGGAVTNVAGPNWMLIGDAAACVNPLNGEGIDYGLETGRLAAEVLAAPDLASLWPSLLREHYGDTFSVARRLAALLTYDWFLPVFGPIGMRSGRMMAVAARVMGNLVTDQDRDVVARAWRLAGTASRRIDARPLWN
ncbi:MAG: geranylgeranyl reductase family protein [Candidatus Nanopelagicales bacterium]